jgi:hypothetical protein
MQKIVIACLLMLSVMTIQARDIAGVSLAEQIVREADSAKLVLNGAGIRKKFFFDIYLASLYLQQQTSDVAQVLNVDKPAQVQMRILYSEVEKDKLVQGWNDGFSANLSADELQVIRARLDQFNAMFETLRAGDLVSLDYMPGKGTIVTIKGVEKGVVAGGDFYQALLKVWLGESPISKSLKKELLGSG